MSHLDDPPSYDVLKSWLVDQGVSVHPALLPLHGPTGWTVTSTSEIPRGEILCTVPKAVMLSHRTASADFLTLPDEPTAADHTLHLASCLLHEIRLGMESRLYAWIQILPRETIPLPTFWSDSSYGEDGRRALQWLAGTEAEKELRRKNDGLGMDDIYMYFDRIRPLFPETPSHHAPPNLSDFLYAFSMVSTRGYVIDAYHIIALVPFVDLFNHSANNHTSLASDSCVCPACGLLSACAHDQPGENRTAHLSPAYLIKAEAEGNCVEMRVERHVKQGVEVFSCYEEDVADSKLLVEWGFVAGEKTGNAVSWSPREIIDSSIGQGFMAILQSGEVARRSLLLAGSRKWIHSSLNPGHFDIRFDVTVSINLLVVLYLHALDVFPDSLDELEEGFIGLMRERIDGRRLSDEPSFDAWRGCLSKLVHARKGKYSKEAMQEASLESDGLSDRTGSLSRLSRQIALGELGVLDRLSTAWDLSSVMN